MATTKTKDVDLADLASELGVSLDSLNSMDIAEIKKLMKSGDLVLSNSSGDPHLIKVI